MLPDGSIAIGGRTTGTLSTTSDALQAVAPGGGSDGMLVVIDAELSEVRIATYLGDASASDAVSALSFDVASGSLVVAGTTGGGLIGTPSGAFAGGATDGFVARVTICD